MHRMQPFLVALNKLSAWGTSKRGQARSRGKPGTYDGTTSTQAS
ncbi:hypothetical protein KDH_73070 [Dictyobacter sp. S3.2.2.5]|uniref:Uncharacterized protein n=1 Tax=Dictyobacter halimunensis TaxID=3026934 RepID=A0ABQ6G1S9_9CHLR|nr:hypothetical protein KDH_73070 [Dictyobacter sp. S3.2.2.5]